MNGLNVEFVFFFFFFLVKRTGSSDRLDSVPQIMKKKCPLFFV